MDSTFLQKTRLRTHEHHHFLTPPNQEDSMKELIRKLLHFDFPTT